MKYFEYSAGGLALMDCGRVIGWVLTTCNRKWTFSIVGDSSKNGIFLNEEDAKKALLKSLPNVAITWPPMA